MMHLLGFGSAEVGPRAANEFENKTAAAPGLRTIGWVIGGHQTTNLGVRSSNFSSGAPR